MELLHTIREGESTEESLEWDDEDKQELSGEAAAAMDVTSVGKTLVQLGAWECTECEINSKQAARFDVVFSVMPGRNARLDYATVTFRLEDKALKVLGLGPKDVKAKDPVKVHRSAGNKIALDVKAGHAPIATVGISGSRTGNVGHEGMVYPCLIKASVDGLSFARWELHGDRQLGANAELSLPLWFALPMRNIPPVIPCKLDVEAYMAINVGGFLPTYTRRCKKKGIELSLQLT